MKDGILKYGAGNDKTATVAAENFIGSALNNLSLCTTPLEMLSNDGAKSIISRASGFFWLCDDQPYLVTNWPVVSGRNPFTEEVLSPKGFIPKAIRFYGTSLKVAAGRVLFTRTPYTVEFSEEYVDSISSPPILENSPVDIFPIPIQEGMAFRRDSSRTGFKGAPVCSCFVNEVMGKRIVTQAGDDCFILGYPLENYDGLILPVWKRGSIATETFLGLGEHPAFLVDSAVTSSMSGAPVFRRATTLTADNKDIGALQEFTSFDFIGVYAGRLQSASLDKTNLGYAWYSSLLDRVIRNT